MRERDDHTRSAIEERVQEQRRGGKPIDAETVRTHLRSARRSLGMPAKGEELPFVKVPVALARWLVCIAEAAYRFEHEAGPFDDPVTESLHTFPAPDGGRIGDPGPCARMTVSWDEQQGIEPDDACEVCGYWAKEHDHG